MNQHAMPARELVRRINRRLACEGVLLRTARVGRQRYDLGAFYLVPLHAGATVTRDVDIEQLGRDLGVLAADEHVGCAFRDGAMRCDVTAQSAECFAAAASSLIVVGLDAACDVLHGRPTIWSALEQLVLQPKAVLDEQARAFFVGWAAGCVEWATPPFRSWRPTSDEPSGVPMDERARRVARETIDLGLLQDLPEALRTFELGRSCAISHAHRCPHEADDLDRYELCPGAEDDEK
jgi:hypothetical protein